MKKIIVLSSFLFLFSLDFTYAVPPNLILPILWPIIAQLTVVFSFFIYFFYKFYWEIKKLFWIKTKSSRLIELSKIVNVPSFFIVRSLDEYKNIESQLYEDKKYILRSSCKWEDTAKFTNAGQSITIWPVFKKDININLHKVFEQINVRDVIIQEYIEWVSWVIFCFWNNDILIEYSSIKEWVTSWIIKPFVAVLPTNIWIYDNIYKNIKKIYDLNWPCDIEFIWLDNPNFVQVRPITKIFDYDRNLENLKMNLQLLPYSNRIENDFCKVLMEREDFDKDFIDLYIENIVIFYNNHFNKKIFVDEAMFIKISNQYFIAKDFIDSLALSISDITNITIYYNKNKTILEEFSNSFQENFQNMLLLSYIYELLWDIKIFELKEKYREFIYSKLSKNKRDSDFFSIKQISSEIKFDKENNIWLDIWYKNEDWIVIVDWKFNLWEKILYKDWILIPPNSIIYTEHLYPNIWKYLNNINSIICKNWSYNSHISILAREYNIPLKIQAISDYDDYLKSFEKAIDL